MTNNHIFLKGIVLPLSSIHGSSHWRRVERFGLKVAEANGADREVVSLFAYLHDARRVNNDDDPGHGERAVVLLDELIKENIINYCITTFYNELPQQITTFGVTISPLSLINKEELKKTFETKLTKESVIKIISVITGFAYDGVKNDFYIWKKGI